MLRLSICLRNMKEIGCSNIRMENIAIRRHGRKLLYILIFGMRARFLSKRPWKGNSTGWNDLLGAWSPRAFSQAVPCVWNVFLVHYRETLKQPLLSELFSDLCTRINFSFSFSTSVASGIAQHLNFTCVFPVLDTHLSYSSLYPNSSDIHWYTGRA